MNDKQPDSGAEQSFPPAPYAWYVVTVLTLAYVLSFLDRQILALLVDPIKRDLGVSDTSMSLLLGLAFAIFYTLLGIPLGRLADRRSRRGIIAIGVTIWCLMTAACGLAMNFSQLFLARIGVGVGEAALNPAALSLISDYFPRERRGPAVSFYTMGVTVGAGIAMVIGGQIIVWAFNTPRITIPIIGELYAWQTVFLLVGLPGLTIAALMATVREPVRRDRLRIEGADTDAPMPVMAAIRFLMMRWRTYSTLFLGMSVVTIIGYGYFFWIPTMFVRTWAWSIADIAMAYGVVSLIFGPLGVIFGGWLAARMYRLGRRDAHMRVTLWGALLLVPSAVAAPLMPTAELGVVMLIPVTIGAAIATATGVAALMMIVPNQLRAQTTALYYFVINVVGLTLGPTAVALATDYLFHDEAALRYSVSLVMGIAGMGALGFLSANLRHFYASVEEADAWSSAST